MKNGHTSTKELIDFLRERFVVILLLFQFKKKLFQPDPPRASKLQKAENKLELAFYIYDTSIFSADDKNMYKTSLN